jgi:hypothetical protein
MHGGVVGTPEDNGQAGHTIGQADYELLRRIKEVLRLSPGSNMPREPRKDANVAVVYEDIGAMPLSRPHGMVLGFGLPASVGSGSDFSASNTVAGMLFDSRTTSQPTLFVSGGATCVFIGCVFRRDAKSAGVYVQVEGGAKAIFTGCRFEGLPAPACVIEVESGVPADCFVIGCTKETTCSWGGVTNVGSM